MITRRSALAGAGALLVAAPAVRAQATGDAALLRRVLDLEQLSVAAYGAAAAGDVVGEELARTAATLVTHEQQHADVLAIQLEALGGQRPPEPQDVSAADALAATLGLEELTPALGSPREFLAWAEALELRSVAAYVDATRRALDVGLIQTLLSVLGSEAQHLAAVRSARGGPVIRGGFEPGG